MASAVLGIPQALARIRATVASKSGEVILPIGAATTNQDAQLESVTCATTHGCITVGYYQDASTGQQAIVTPIVNGTRGDSHKVALPTGAASSQNAGLYSVSCLTATSCVATGSYIDATTNYEPMVVPITYGAPGTAHRVTLPAGAATNQNATLESVSCALYALATSCVGVGSYKDATAGTEVMVALITNGTPGTAQEVTLPTGAAPSGQDAGFVSVNCASATRCVAVGYYKDATAGYEAMVAPITNGTPGTAQEVTLPTGAAPSGQDAGLSSVSCDPGACVATGYYKDATAGYEAMVAPITNGVPKAAHTVILPTGAKATGQNAELSSVSCTSAAFCVATGHYKDAISGQQAMFVPITNGAPKTTRKVKLPTGAKTTGQDATLNSVSCASTSSCIASGYYTGATSGQQALAVPIIGGTTPGSAHKVALPNGAAIAGQSASLRSVSCASPTSCVAAGDYVDTSNQTQGLVTAIRLRPRLVIRRGALNLHGHRVRVQLLCRDARCRGTVKLRLRHKVNGKRRTETIAHHRFSIRAGHNKNFRITVNATGRRAIHNAPRHRIHVIEVVTVKRGPNRKHHKVIRYGKY